MKIIKGESLETQQPCENCTGLTLFLYDVIISDKKMKICTSCKSIIGLALEGKFLTGRVFDVITMKNNNIII